MKCGNCGAEIPETANFCRFCGAAQEVIPVSDSDETEAENAPVSEQLDNSDELRAAIFTLQNQVSLLNSRLAALEQSLAGAQSTEPQRPPPTPSTPAPPRTGQTQARPAAQSEARAYPTPSDPPHAVPGQAGGVIPERPSPTVAAPVSAQAATRPVSSDAPSPTIAQSHESAPGEVATASPGSSFNWEWLLGGNWLARIGIVALIIGVGFFLKLAFDNQWIGETGRVLLGLSAGVVLLAAG